MTESENRLATFAYVRSELQPRKQFSFKIIVYRESLHNKKLCYSGFEVLVFRQHMVVCFQDFNILYNIKLSMSSEYFTYPSSVEDGMFAIRKYADRPSRQVIVLIVEFHPSG